MKYILLNILITLLAMAKEPIDMTFEEFQEFKKTDAYKEHNQKMETKKKKLKEKIDKQSEANRITKEAFAEASSPQACMGYVNKMRELMEESDRHLQSNGLATKEAVHYAQKAVVYAEKYKKYNCNRLTENTVQPKKKKVDREYSDIIMSNCRKKWNTNYKMIKYCVDKQTEAHRSISYLPENIIMTDCRVKWGANYKMIKYCYDKQAEAKHSISSLPKGDIMRNCEKKWGTNYKMIKYCVDKQTEARNALGL